MFNLSPPTTTAERFEVILSHLVKEIVAQRGSSRVFGALAYLLWNRIMAVCNDAVAVIREIEAGIVRPLRLARRRAIRGTRVVSEAARARMRDLAATWNLRGKQPGWLVAEGGWKVAGYGGQLEALLAMPEVRRLLLASPRLGLALRPVCRMLGVDAALYEAPAPLTEAELVVLEAADAEAAAKAAAPPEPPPEAIGGVIPWYHQKWANGRW